MSLRTLFAVIVVLCTTAAFADASWGLRWKAPEACIQPAELARKVEDRLGRAVFSGDASLRIDGVLEPSGTSPRWRARLTVVDADGSIRGNREVTGDGECRALDENLALVVSVMVDPNAAVAPTPPPPPPPPAPAPPALVGAALDEAGVRVTLEVNDPEARLYRVTGQGTGTVWSGGASGTMVINHFTAECAAPCDKRITNPADSFFVGGPGFAESKRFSLHLYPRGVHVKAKVGPLGARVAGIMLMVLGVSAAVPGLLMVGVGATGRSSSSSGLTGAGLLLAGGGALMIGGGIPLLRWGATDVEVLPLD